MAGEAGAFVAVTAMPIAAMLASLSLSSIGSNAPTKIAKSSADLKHEQEVAKLKRKADFMSKRHGDLAGENAAQTRAALDAFAASEEAQDKEDARALEAVVAAEEEEEAANEKKNAAPAPPAASAAAEAAASAKLARVSINSDRSASEGKESKEEDEEDKQAFGPDYGEIAKNAAIAERARMAQMAQSFWKAVNYGLENKTRRLDDAITMGTKNPELLTMLYDEPPLPLLVRVIQIAKGKAVNDDIETYMGDFLGRNKRAADKAEADAARVRTARDLVKTRKGGRTRRQRGGARTTDLEKFTQMILNRIITESATDQSISLQAADAFAELVKYENPKNNDKIAKYLAGVFSQFMKIKKDGKKTPNIVADVLFETMTPTDKINPGLLDQKSWLVFQNELKADPRVVAALKEKAAAAAARVAEMTAARDKGDRRRLAEEAKAASADPAAANAAAPAAADANAADAAAPAAASPAPASPASPASPAPAAADAPGSINLDDVAVRMQNNVAPPPLPGQGLVTPFETVNSAAARQRRAAAPPSALRTRLGRDDYPRRPYGGRRRRTPKRRRKSRKSTFRRHRKH